jgi:hypothetical protein
VRFELWRVRRAPGARIPATLWKSAVKLAGQHGVSRVATALKLDYYALKRRLEHQPVPVVDVEVPSAPPAFVELAPSACSSSGQCLIEFVNSTGSTLRVHLPSGQVPDLVALVRSVEDAS